MENHTTLGGGMAAHHMATGSLLGKVPAFRHLNMGFSWSWSVAVWGVASNLGDGWGVGAHSTPAWIVATVVSACALAVTAVLVRLLGRPLPFTLPSVVFATVCATLGTVMTGGIALFGVVSWIAYAACGVLVGVGWSLMIILQTTCYSRASAVDLGIAIPMCKVATVIVALVMGAALDVATWPIACALPPVAMALAWSMYKKDVAVCVAESTDDAPVHMLSLRNVVWCAAVVVAYALFSMPEGGIDIIPVEMVATSQSFSYALSALVPIAMALATASGARRWTPAGVFRWVGALSTVGGLFYLQTSVGAHLGGQVVFFIADTLIYIVVFSEAASAGRRHGIVTAQVQIALLFASCQVGNLIGNVAGMTLDTLAIPVFSVLMGLLACLFALIGSLRTPLAEEQLVTTVRGQGDDRGAMLAACDAIADEVGLSPRQRDVLELLVRGRSVPWISRNLGLAEGTVSSYAKHIYAKLDVHSKQALLDYVSERAEKGV